MFALKDYLKKYENTALHFKQWLVEGLPDNIQGGFYHTTASNRVFAYVGYPIQPKPESGYPAVVLIHGGGGKAYHEWVQKWTEKGYVAIAPDFDAQYADSVHENPRHNENGGPHGYGAYDLSDDNWMYHSILSIQKAIDVLVADEQVDASKIAVCGISWGGCLALTACGVDERIRAGAIIYSSAFYNENNAPLRREIFAAFTDEEKEIYNTYIDPCSCIGNIKCPMFFTAGMDDGAFIVANRKQTTESITAEKVFSFRRNYPHGHSDGWGEPEPYDFIDRIFRDREQVKIQVTCDGCSCKVNTNLEYRDIFVLYTAEDYRAQEQCVWATDIVSGDTFVLDDAAKAFFVKVVTKDGMQYSSDVMDVPGCENVRGYYKLDKYVREQEALSDTYTTDKWKVMPYETPGFRGNLLIAGQLTSPPPLTLDLGVTGEYDVYLGMVPLGGNSLGIQVTAEEGKTCASPDFGREWDWDPSLWIRECRFRTVDFKDGCLTVFKPEHDAGDINGYTAIAYVKLVKTENKQTADVKRIAFHFDNDFVYEMDYPTVESYLGRLDLLDGLGGGRILYEVNNFDRIDKNGFTHGKYGFTGRPYYAEYLQRKQEVEKAVVSKARLKGFETFATVRMQMSDFVFPHGTLSPHYQTSHLFEKYTAQGCNCRSRDGRKIDVVSYAFSDVRHDMAEKLTAWAEDFDGVSLVYIRGTYVAFEQPVLQRFHELYGEDATRIPMADERLQNVMCEPLTAFMTELRAMLDERYGTGTKKIDVIVYYDPASSKKFGMDTETWMKNRLVDSISQGIMRHDENLDNCLDDAGLVDMDRYHAEVAKRWIIGRHFDHDSDTILSGAREFIQLCRKYDTPFYATLGWQHMYSQDTVRLVKALREIGAEQFIAWNGNHACRLLPNLEAIKYAMQNIDNLADEVPMFYKMVRVLSRNDVDNSYVNPNWIG